MKKPPGYAENASGRRVLGRFYALLGLVLIWYILGEQWYISTIQSNEILRLVQQTSLLAMCHFQKLIGHFQF